MGEEEGRKESVDGREDLYTLQQDNISLLHNPILNRYKICNIIPMIRVYNQINDEIVLTLHHF